MSKDYRFNKKEYDFEDEEFEARGASSKRAGHKKQMPEKKAKASFQRVDKRNIA